jgi:hypothetical protein
VWHDVAGGVNGDNTDNHWTDNQIGTADDRYLNTDFTPQVQWCFAWLQARIHRAFAANDPRYAGECLQAGQKVFEAASKRFPVETEGTLALAYALLAALELWRQTGDDAHLKAGRERLQLLLGRQETGWAAGQKRVRGFFYSSTGKDSVLTTPWDPAALAWSLIEGAEVLPGTAGGQARQALQLYFDSYILPLCALSPMEVLPYGIWLEPQTHDHYRPLEGPLTYRFFMPIQTPKSQPNGEAAWWNGPNGHILGHAAALLHGSRLLGSPEYRRLALKQLEWIHGANPLAVSTVTGHGLSTVYPHARYVGLIPGGVMPGISGDADDRPIFGRSHSDDWQTTEYWSPSQAGYVMALCELHDQWDLSTDIGRQGLR